MEQDLKALEKIFKGPLNYTNDYIKILINLIKSKLDDSGKTHITPHFLYATLAFEIGRNNAKDVSEEFEDYKKTGNYKSKLERHLDRSQWMK